MLIQAKLPKGMTRVEATSEPPTLTPQPLPSSSIRRQSASFWFQCAALESARQPARCWAPSGWSVLPIPGFEVRRLAQARPAALDPVGLPVDHALERHARRAEQLARRRGIH